MIPLIRSLSELMAISKYRDPIIKITDNYNSEYSSIDSGQRKRYLKSMTEQTIDLPNLPRLIRRKWKRREDDILKFFDKLYYTNQIQATYDLTLQARQKNYKNNDVA